VIERIEQLTEAGFTDGLLLEADNADTFSWLATDVLPMIGRASRDPTEGSRTFRGRLGLERPANRYDSSGMRA
jgi:hypothetical protein